MSDEEGDALSLMLGNGASEKTPDNCLKKTIRKYGDEWSELIDLSSKGLEFVQRHALQMHLEKSRLRSIYWQLLLKSLPSSPSLWISILRQQRNSYRLLRQRLTVDPRQAGPNDDPLSQNYASVWHQYFCDRELRAMIRQDVVRTFPSVDFFRSESIQCTMVNILFCYAREHPEMCYRQGMHEVLAPLLAVMHSDQQSLLHAQELASVSPQAVEILDPTCLEEDAYWLFCSLMSQLAGSYRVRDVAPLLTGHFPSSRDSYRGEVETELATRLKHIRDELLARFDPELHSHLVSLDIQFQTFGIRWLRVLFGQEFPLPKLLYLWDAIFADGESFALVNFIVVSMISAIRDQLIDEDDSECLMLLMRYPSGVDVKSVVENAMQMRRPRIYSPSKETSSKKETVEAPLPAIKTVSHSNSISGRLKKLSLWSQRKEPPVSSAPRTFMPNTSVTSSRSTSTRLDKSDKIESIVEGFTLNDPSVARAELRHLHNIIALVYSHLERHHATLERTLPPNTPHNARLALTGIKEVWKHHYHLSKLCLKTESQ